MISKPASSAAPVHRMVIPRFYLAGYGPRLPVLFLEGHETE
jgi:hypothetical protein